MINILVVDDHPLMRRAIISAIQGEGDLSVVGQAIDGQQAVVL